MSIPFDPDLDKPIHGLRGIALAGELLLRSGKPNVTKASRLVGAGVIKAKKRGTGRHARYSSTRRQIIESLTGVVLGCFALIALISGFVF
jgi:hypothetical protein